MPTVRTYKAPDGNYPYARAVLAEMENLVTQGMKDPLVQSIAQSLTGASWSDTLENDFVYLKKRVPYIQDPPDIERITSARLTVGKGMGEDCDGQSVAVATVLALQGIPSKFRVIAWRKPEFTHVFTVAYPGDPRETILDLTQDRINKTYPYKTFLDGNTMAQIQAISDGGNSVAHRVSELVSVMVHSTDPLEQKRAFAELARRYPREMNYWAARVHTEGSLTNHRIGDMGDWLSSVLGTAAGFVTNIIAPGAGGVVSSIVGGTAAAGAGSSQSGPLKPGDPDPNRPGRSVTDARTWIEEINNVYGAKVVTPKKQAMNDGANFASVIWVAQLPQLDQHIQDQFPGLIFASWDGSSFWGTNFKSFDATPVGNAYKLTFHGPQGDMDARDYYNREVFTDGSERYDNIGSSTAGASTSATQQAQTQNSTANRVEQGLPPMQQTNVPTQPTTPGGGAAGGGAAGAGATGLPAEVQQAAAGFFSGNTPLYIGLGLLGVMLLSKR